MENLFLDVLNLSITAGWLIAAVLLVRLVIRKRAPKWICCLLWGMVGLRLVLPFSLESALSLVPSRETVIPESVYGEVARPVTPPDNIPDTPVITPEVSENDIPDMPVINTYPEEYIHSGIGIIDNKVNPIIQSTATVTENGKETNILQTVTKIGSIVWVCGMAALAVYAVINYLLLKKRISFSVPEGKDIRKSEAVGSPFILGIFRPRIYLPFGLSAETEAHVIAHERAHLKRNDHLIKPLGYAVLTLHWFNPLVWAAYILLCRDIEYACDEKVVKNMSAEARKAYAEALLECGVSRSMISACPVAFGEIGVKKRVKNALNYKKPLFWVMIVAVVICAAVAVLFLTSPAVNADEEASTDVSEDVSAEMSETSKSEDEVIKITPPALGDTDPLDLNLYHGVDCVIAKHITLDERIEDIKKSESKVAFCIVELTELNFVEDENNYSNSYVDLKFKIVKTIAKSSSWILEENQEISSFQQFVYWKDVDGITEVQYTEDFSPPFLVCGSYYGVTINDGQVPKDSPEGYDVSVTNLTIPLNDKSINDTEYRNKLYKELQMALGNQSGYYENCETIIDRYFEKTLLPPPETSEPEPETSEDEEALYRADIDELLSGGRTTAHFYNDYYLISYDRVNDKYSCSSGMFKYKYSDGKITVLFDSGTLTEIDGSVENYNTLIQAYQNDFETKINALFDVLQDEKTEITNFRKVDKTSHAFSIKGTYTYIDDGKEKTAAVTGDITYYINKGANLSIKLDGETWMSGTLRYTYADVALPLTKIYKTEKYSSMAEFDANVKEFMSFYDSVKLLFNDGNLLNKYLEMSLHRNEPYVPKDKSDTAGGLSSVVVRQLTLGTEENFVQAVIAKRIHYTSYYKNGKDMGGWERNVYSYIENGESHFLDKKRGYGFQGGGYFDHSDEHKLETRTLEDTILWYYDGLLVVMDRNIYTEVSKTEYELYFNCSANFIDTSYTHHSDGTVTVITDCADDFISNLIYNFMPSEHGPRVKKHRNNTEKETMIFTYGQDGVFRGLEFVTDYTCKLTVTDAEGMTLPAKADIFAGNWN